MTEKRVALAAVAGAHGVKGEVRLKLFADSIASLTQHAKVHIGGVERRLLGLRDGGRTAVARFEGLSDWGDASSATWRYRTMPFCCFA